MHHNYVQTSGVVYIYSQYLSTVVEMEYLPGQARALRTLAGVYEKTQQMTKAEDHYRKVCTCVSKFVC